MKLFRNRRDAGRQLAAALARYAGRSDAIVLALPRGGVPVAAEVADQLRLPLDVLVVRKLGAPNQPELAMGAIAQVAGAPSAIVMNPEVEAYFADRPDAVVAVEERERQELMRREKTYRGQRPPLMLKNKIVILIDDGAATGATMRAAVEALRSLSVQRVVVALPVASVEAEDLLRAEADDLIVLQVPQFFYAVGQWYDEFGQTADEEVRELLG